MFEFSVILSGVFTLIIASIEPVCEITNKEISAQWKKVIFVVLVVSVVSSPVLAIICHNIDKEDSMQTSYLLKEHTLPHLYQNDSLGIYIKLGGGNALILERSCNHLSFSQYSPIYFRANEKGEAFVNCIIRDKNGRIGATIQDSKLINYPGSSYDINFDEDAYEVVDKKGNVCIQITTDSIQSVHCYKILYALYLSKADSNGVFALETSDKSMFSIGGSGVPKLSTEPIFKYPGYKFTGIRK
jgi:hypothetical protein